MKIRPLLGFASAAALALPLLTTGSARAFPGFFAYQGQKPVNHATHRNN